MQITLDNLNKFCLDEVLYWEPNPVFTRGMCTRMQHTCVQFPSVRMKDPVIIS